MKIMKKLRLILILVIVLVIILVVGFHLFGTKAMKMGIETGGKTALKVPVAVEDVSLSILAGKAGVTNLIIGVFAMPTT